MKYGNLVEAQDAPYAFSLGLEPGTTLRGEGHYPDLAIQSVTEKPVKEIRWQLLRVKAEHPNQDGEEFLMVGRLVAVLGNGSEVEVGERTVLLADMVETGIDMTTCASCGRKNLQPDSMAVHEAKAYCPMCFVE